MSSHRPVTQPLDPDRDEARELLRTELAEPDYNRADSVVAAVTDWVMGLLDELLRVLPASTSLGWLLVLLVVLLVAVATAFAVRGRRRAGALSGVPVGAVLERADLTADDYRARATAAAGRADWSAAVLDWFRALTSDAAARTLLDDVPALTAREVATSLAVVFPDHAGELSRAARDFDTVRYGGGSLDEEAARHAQRLDRALATGRPRLGVPG